MGEREAGTAVAVLPGGKLGLATQKKRDLFLDALVATCCVEQAAAAAGLSPSAFYMLRRRDHDFAAQWREAQAVGYDRLEQRLLLRALDGLETSEGTADGSAPQHVGGAAKRVVGAGSAQGKASDAVQLAMAMLNRQRVSLERQGRATRIQYCTDEELDAALCRRIAQVAKRMKLPR